MFFYSLLSPSSAISLCIPPGLRHNSVSHRLVQSEKDLPNARASLRKEMRPKLGDFLSAAIITNDTL